MRRRQFLEVGLGALAWPSIAHSDTALPLVGWLSSAFSLAEGDRKAFQAGLFQLGYEAGRNVKFEYRYSGGNYDRLQTLADELVGLNVNALVAGTSYPVVLAAKKATTTTPVIFLTGVDPVPFGLVQSMNRPGGNLTGFSLLANQLTEKRIELFDELLPRTVAIAALVNSANPATVGNIVKGAEQTVQKLGREFIVVQASNKFEIETAFRTVAGKKAALFVWNEAYFSAEHMLIVSLAEQYSIPCIYGSRYFVDAGGLLSYGADLAEAYRSVGNYTGKVLRGTSPAGLPVLQPTKYELVINLKTAKALGLQMPSSLITRADQILE